MTKNVTEGKRSIQWGLIERLEDLDSAGNIFLLSQNQTDMERKLRDFKETAETMGLKVNVGKTKTMKINSRDINRLQVNDMDVEEVDHFTYFGTVVTKGGGLKRTSAFARRIIQLYPVWKAKEISLSTKLRIFRINVKAVTVWM